MSAPGWYPDPQDPSSARYWDGCSWGQQTQDLRPSGGGRSRALAWVIGSLTALAVIVAAVLIVPTLLRPGGPGTGGDDISTRPTESQWDELPTTPTPSPSDSVSPRPSRASEKACPRGDYESVSGPLVGGRATGGGLSFALQGDWTIGHAYSDMNWADDVAMYAHSAPVWWSFAGVAAIHPGEGWDTPHLAAGYALDCLASTAFYQSVEKVDVQHDEERTIDGVTGWWVQAEVTSGSGLVDRVIVIVLPTGGDRLGVFASAVKNTEQQLLADVDAAIGTLRVDG